MRLLATGEQAEGNLVSLIDSEVGVALGKGCDRAPVTQRAVKFFAVAFNAGELVHGFNT